MVASNTDCQTVQINCVGVRELPPVVSDTLCASVDIDIVVGEI